MDIKSFRKKSRILLGLIVFIATGGGLIVSTAINGRSFYKTEILLIIGCFFAISLMDHSRVLVSDIKKLKFNKKTLYIIICSIAGSTLTWLINHKIGYGAIVANGLIGVIAATFLPNDLASITYTSSFVGMSSLAVIPSVWAATIGGFIISIVLIASAEIYAGIGGKGGTTAALSTIITKTIIRFLNI